MAINVCIDSGYCSLSSGLFVAGGSVYLSGKEQVLDYFLVQLIFQMDGVEVIIFDAESPTIDYQVLKCGYFL